MTDMTMCTNHMCPNAPCCKRHRAKASESQSHRFFNYQVSSKGVVCDHYIPSYSISVR